MFTDEFQKSQDKERVYQGPSAASPLRPRAKKREKEDSWREGKKEQRYDLDTKSPCGKAQLIEHQYLTSRTHWGNTFGLGKTIRQGERDAPKTIGVKPRGGGCTAGSTLMLISLARGRKYWKMNSVVLPSPRRKGRER